MKPEIMYKYGIKLVFALLILYMIVDYQEKIGEPLNIFSKTLIVIGFGTFEITSEFVNELWRYGIKKGWLKNENN